MQRFLALPMTVAAVGCAAATAELRVAEIAGSAQCNTPAGAAPYAVLAGAGQLRGWQEARRLPGAEADEGGRYLALEMGRRSTGGYAIKVEPVARLKGDTLYVTADFSSPAPGAMVSQALTSPCKLLKLPEGNYQRIEVRDSEGRVLTGQASKDAVPAS